MDTPEIPTEPMDPAVYNDLLKHYSGIALQSTLAKDLAGHYPSEVIQVAYEYAIKMISAYDLFRRNLND